MKMFMDVSVTDSFLGLDEDIRKCQRKDKFEKCVLTNSVDNMLKECGCVPLHIATMQDKVVFLNKVL